MQSKTLNQLQKLHNRNFDNLSYFCKQKDNYCKKRDIISLKYISNKKQLAFVYRQIAFFNKKIEYCFDKHNEIIEKAQLLQAVND